jgi:signal peptidase
VSSSRRRDDGRSRPPLDRVPDGVTRTARDTATSVGALLMIGLCLFLVSGAWPPLVAVESGSMAPHLQKGDLVFVADPGRVSPENEIADTGVVTAAGARDADHRSFDGYGSVVVYEHPRVDLRIVHRARFWVDAGENWYGRANPEYLRADSCRELANCPAPHAGFITKGDANSRYDQAAGFTGPVRPESIHGVARARVPHLGRVRMLVTGALG